MRNVTMCDIRLHPSTAESSFEEAMVDDVLRNAGDVPLPPGSLFVRGLYRVSGEAFPPAYRCIVNTTLVSDSGFFRMRPSIHDLGADTSQPRFRHLAGALPNDETVLRSLENEAVVVTINVPLDVNQDSFETALVAAVDEEVGRSTRLNNIVAALWTRHDSTESPDGIEYLVAAFGDIRSPELRPATASQIRAAGGQVIESLGLRHVGTVFDDGHHPPASTSATPSDRAVRPQS